MTKAKMEEEFIKQLKVKDQKHKVNVIDMLNHYSRWLEKQGYMDSDWYCEEPHTVDEFVKLNNLW